MHGPINIKPWYNLFITYDLNIFASGNTCTVCVAWRVDPRAVIWRVLSRLCRSEEIKLNTLLADTNWSFITPEVWCTLRGERPLLLSGSCLFSNERHQKSPTTLAVPTSYQRKLRPVLDLPLLTPNAPRVTTILTSLMISIIRPCSSLTQLSPGNPLY